MFLVLPCDNSSKEKQRVNTLATVIKNCRECGEEYIGRTNSLYCGKICAKKRWNRQKGERAKRNFCSSDTTAHDPLSPVKDVGEKKGFTQFEIYEYINEKVHDNYVQNSPRDNHSIDRWIEDGDDSVFYGLVFYKMDHKE